MEEIEAGIVLRGDEVKEVRAGHVNLQGAFGRIRNGELWLTNATIGLRSESRKLLVHKKELIRLSSKLNEKNLMLVPTRIFFTRGWAKIVLRLARHKTQYDKRQSIAKKDYERIRRQQAD